MFTYLFGVGAIYKLICKTELSSLSRGEEFLSLCGVRGNREERSL